MAFAQPVGVLVSWALEYAAPAHHAYAVWATRAQPTPSVSIRGTHASHRPSPMRIAARRLDSEPEIRARGHVKPLDGRDAGTTRCALFFSPLTAARRCGNCLRIALATPDVPRRAPAALPSLSTFYRPACADICGRDRGAASRRSSRSSRPRSSASSLRRSTSTSCPSPPPACKALALQVLRGPARHLRAPTPCSSSSAAVEAVPPALIELVASSLVGFCAASLVPPVSLLHPKRLLPRSSAPTPASSRQNLRRLHRRAAPSGIAGHQPLRAAAYACDLVRTSHVHASYLALVIVQHIRRIWTGYMRRICTGYTV